MSNLAGVTKDMYPEGTVATAEGLFGSEGELLVGVAVTQAEMDEFNGTSSASPKPTRVTAKSTKEEMEIAGRDMGIELDRRKSKKSLWTQLKKVMK